MELEGLGAGSGGEELQLCASQVSSGRGGGGGGAAGAAGEKFNLAKAKALDFALSCIVWPSGAVIWLDLESSVDIVNIESSKSIAQVKYQL